MKQLPADTVRLLSSSQVVTSVLSVVKELLENSLDAGASSVDVKLENFGLDRTEVRDDGCGINAADAPVMAVRHFTSKICSHDDLARLETYGFRGEALGSICAVAEVAVTTKTEQDDVGTQYTLDCSGNVVSQRPSHLGRGTSVSVTKLFRKLPVRRQFYSSTKKCKEELKKVQELLTAYAIIRPPLRLMLAHNKVVLWQKARATDFRSALVATLGPAAVANLLPCRREQPEMVLDGFLPRPGADLSSSSSSTSDKTFIFINDRPVQHKELMKLLRQHYSAQYPDDAARHRYPVLALHVTVPPSSLDVNLTPDKTQVLLGNKEAVLTAVEALLLSLYGARPAEEQPGETGAPPPQEESRNHEGGHDDRPAADLQRQASSCSSSSSVADDWIVNQSSFFLCDDQTPPSCSKATESGSASGSPEEPENRDAAETGTISAEAWSRGAALTDPTTGEPLRPVALHRPSEGGPPGSEEARSRNAVTEKRAALTAYHMISSRALKAPPSAAALFDREVRAEVLREQPAAGLQEISAAVQKRWRNLREEDRKRFEEKAKKKQDLHDQRTKLASDEGPGAKGQKRKAPQSNQQLLDELFSAQPQKKKTSAACKPWQPLPCSVAALRRRLQRLSSQSAAAAPRGLRLLSRLGSQSSWVLLRGQRLMLLNPFRVEEALLFKRLQENHVLPAVVLQNPVPLTQGNLGGPEYLETLCGMERSAAGPDGAVFFSDPRLVANGFKVQLTAAGEHLEVTAVADCVPFLGVDDLREVLAAVLHRKASAVPECRPLKVTNFLKAEAVRLARQRPGSLCREDVEELVQRMERQLGGTDRTCIHGRQFVQNLADVPSTEQEAKALITPLQL
ncbi:PMS1 protein homolog 1 [Fundulus heteroclitus]|uniref:PMS1 protein homolog 1 n=1 Tax=Fundulus heteroclitus TaxID=8078 RepID=UPI00165BFC6A|nr:PMS1 protein homolog 1 [Fundulus heteroclitus]XP_035988519.1 PMS1 protein homolog 1 [Fundulus heteroclitus]XP_035988520.1 PMS1 protein homolog 1 [Fundulus heteroclitus]XP_035988521.1 PMS1 protein homolog 1 [Fundulus heteroclitus]XP_035988522.1 PMS1 protein homolog 1 [Fundulus heteroclitus]XP_035988523.1 PMS1 protein homolog 1 [Fundulus heteroclitus]